MIYFLSVLGEWGGGGGSLLRATDTLHLIPDTETPVKIKSNSSSCKGCNFSVLSDIFLGGVLGWGVVAGLHIGRLGLSIVCRLHQDQGTPDSASHGGGVGGGGLLEPV